MPRHPEAWEAGLSTPDGRQLYELQVGPVVSAADLACSVWDRTSVRLAATVMARWVTSANSASEMECSLATARQ
jgi:hypothetical protein